MHDLKRIKDLLAQQADLTAQFEELDAVLDTYKNLRNRQEFIPHDISTSICTMLTEIQTSQDAFLTGYKALDFGETPASISACKAELDDYETYIIEKAVYVDVINFILSLTSDNDAANAALEQHKLFVVSYDCRSNSADQCAKDLKKYILLRNAFREQDPAKRLSDIIELSPLIDFPLVVALNTNSLKIMQKEVPVQEKISVPEKAAETKPASAPGETVKKAPGPGETVKAVPAPEENVKTVPAPEETVKTMPAPEETVRTGHGSEISDRREEPDYWKPKFPMPDFSAAAKPVSGRPAPDEKPVSHQGIESVLNAELTQVLSRETVAASLAADVEHTSSLPKTAAAPAGGEIPDPWGNIGITNPAAVCYSVDDARMRIFRCERPKKFSVSDFQKEMSLRTKNRFQKQWAFKDACRYGATTPHILGELIREDPAVVKEACDVLVESGYLKAFEINGTEFDGFERLYVLTASGRKVFTNPETASLLNLAAVDKTVTPPFATHANAVLNRQLFLKSRKLMELYMPSRQFNVGSFILEPNSFINFFPSTNGSGTHAYVSVLGKEVKDYLIFKVELQEVFRSLNTITVVGMNRSHARALAEWIFSSFSDACAGKQLQYYSLQDDTYYTYPQDSSFRTQQS